MEYTGKYKGMAEQFRKDGCDEYIVEKFIRQEMEKDEFHKGDGITDPEAVKLWNTYPDGTKDMWLHNAFCTNCRVSSFAPGYVLRKDNFGVVIQGKCEKCGEPMTRCCDYKG